MTTLIVETGHLEAGANTFCSLADFKLYSANTGDDTYTGFTDAEVNTAIANAAVYLKIRYQWRGTRVNLTQTLVYPRSNVTDDDGMVHAITDIPQVLKDAQCEAAIRILQNGSLIPDLQPDQLISRQKIEVPGAVIKDIQYLNFPQKRFPEITALLRPLIYSNYQTKVTRA